MFVFCTSVRCVSSIRSLLEHGLPSNELTQTVAGACMMSTERSPASAVPPSENTPAVRGVFMENLPDFPSTCTAPPPNWVFATKARAAAAPMAPYALAFGNTSSLGAASGASTAVCTFAFHPTSSHSGAGRGKSAVNCVEISRGTFIVTVLARGSASPRRNMQIDARSVASMSGSLATSKYPICVGLNICSRSWL